VWRIVRTGACRMVSAVAIATLFAIASVPQARATSNQSTGRSTAERIVGVLDSVAPHRIAIASLGGGDARTFRTDVLTTVCYEPNLCLQSGNTSPLLPGATVTAQVATNKRGVAHASTIFVTSVAATIRIDTVDGDVITGRSTRSDTPFTIVRRPFTVVVDASGEAPGAVPDLQIGAVLYFTGLAGFDRGSPVTIAARLFP
jgi:hypothetical protein